MRYEVLGTTGIEVSRLCRGSMMFGRLGNRDHEDCLRIIHQALASILHAGLVGSGVAGAGWLWGVIAPGGHDCWAGVARWAGVPGPVGFLGSVGRGGVVSGGGGPKSLPGWGDGVAQRQVASMRSRVWRAARVMRAATCRTR